MPLMPSLPIVIKFVKLKGHLLMTLYSFMYHDTYIEKKRNLKDALVVQNGSESP